MRVAVLAFLAWSILGFPSLSSAGDDVYVNPYYRRDGTYVPSHWRSAPDGDRSNNYGSLGSWQSPSTPYYMRDYDGDGLLNQYDLDDNNNGVFDNNE